MDNVEDQLEPVRRGRRAVASTAPRPDGPEAESPSGIVGDEADGDTDTWPGRAGSQPAWQGQPAISTAELLAHRPPGQPGTRTARSDERASSHRPGVSPAGDRGGPPRRLHAEAPRACNTAAPKYRRPVSAAAGTEPAHPARVLASGVDSLYFSARGTLWDPSLWALEETQKQAARERRDIPVEFPDDDGTMLMQPRGRRQYDMWLTSPAFELGVGSDDGQPDAYVQLHASYIHTVGVEAAVADAQQFLRRYLFCGPFEARASRVDLRVDEQGWHLQHDDLSRLLTRARSRRAYDQVHLQGRRFCGFVFGRRDVVARIYDKTLEMSARGETWPELLWHNRDPKAPVWRIELQFRRQTLRTCGITSPEDALERRQDLWEYGMRWVSLRDPNGDRNPARWPEAAEWTTLREAPIGSPHSPLVRDRVRDDSELRLVRGLVGYASSVAALNRSADVVGGAIVGAVPAAGHYLRSRGISFVDLVEAKRRRSGRAPSEAAS